MMTPFASLTSADAVAAVPVAPVAAAEISVFVVPAIVSVSPVDVRTTVPTVVVIHVTVAVDDDVVPPKTAVAVTVSAVAVAVESAVSVYESVIFPSASVRPDFWVDAVDVLRQAHVKVTVAFGSASPN